MRVLHLPYNIASQISITVRALRRLGVDARGLVLNGADLQDDKDIENHRVGLPIWRHPLRSSRESIQWFQAFRSAVHWADVVHWHYTVSNWPFHWDLRTIARLNKPRLVEFWGTDIRDPELACIDNPYLSNLIREKEAYAISSRSSLAVQKAFSDAGFTCLIPGPELFDYLRSDLFPEPIRTEAAVQVSEIKTAYPDPDKAKPVVGHIPSRPKVKGTETVLAAVQSLAGQCDFEFRLIQNVTHAQALEQIRECDVVLDQFIIGSYGTVSLEAMALGKPVLCYIKPSFYKRLPDEFPIVNANPGDLTRTLKGLLVDGRLRHSIGLKSREYAERHHDALVVAEQMVGIYRRLMKSGT